MTKAKLIKREAVTTTNTSKKTAKEVRPTVKKTLQIVNEWIDGKRKSSVNPREAFAALFVHPQEQ